MTYRYEPSNRPALGSIPRSSSMSMVL
jgi:hypothetical protein